MRNASIAVWSVLFVLSAIGACVTWTRDTPERAGSVAVLSLDAEDIQSVRLETRARIVELHREAGSFRVVVIGGKGATERAPSSTEHSHDHGFEQPTLVGAQGERREFPGNERCLEIFQRIARLSAASDLGEVAEDRLADFGIEAAETLIVGTPEGVERLELGKLLFGTATRYVRHASSGRLYVVDTALFKDLENEGPYVDRRLHSFLLAQTDSAIIHWGARELTLFRATEFMREALPLWAPVDRPDVDNELYGNWLRKTAGLYAVDFPTLESGERSYTLRVDYLRDGVMLGSLELIEDLTADENSPERYRARGEMTSDGVFIQPVAAREILQDLDNLFKQ